MCERTEQFIAAARLYCEWEESNYRPDLKSTRQALELITELYLCGVRLSGKTKSFKYTKTPVLFKLRRGDNIKPRKGKLPFDHYSEIFDPIPVQAEEPVTGSLRDDLSSIYCDVKKGFILLDAGYEQDAVKQWIINMQIHWGGHATSAIRALHCYLSQKDGFYGWGMKTSRV